MYLNYGKLTLVMNIWGTSKRKRTLTSADKKRIAANQGYKCKHCRETFGTVYHIDHIKPHSEGGSDRDSNLQALCPNCHAEKTEADRHKKKQAKTRAKKKLESGGLLSKTDLLGPRPKRKDIAKILGDDAFSPFKKSGKKKFKNPF